MKRILSCLFYGALGLATMEMAARIDDAINEDAPLWKPYTISSVFQPSPFGREGKPNARFGKWTMNEWGYRGPSPQAGRINVVTFGASETFGIYESPDHEYPRVLETRLNEAAGAQRYNVINLAIPGVRIGRWGYLDRGIKQFKAKVVVIYPSPANYIGSEKPLCDQPSSPVPDQIGIKDRIRLTGKVEQLSKKVLPPSIMTMWRQHDIAKSVQGITVVDKVPESNIQSFKTDLACAVRTAHQAGAQVLLATHATYFGTTLRDSDRPMMTAWRRFYPELKEEGFIDLEQRTNAAIKELAQEMDLEMVDVDKAIPPGPDNFADFVHFTDAGAARMAQLLAPHVLKLTSAPAAP
ncbi:MAG TPA: SGNH/GDSL hydrolase family protein [Aquabacterium sp.]|uniref:SGNH/GDSL hydrolase family protein n=1 Tax=Aquabacterium sp. TaxID=1872578 RepID=UPI002E362D88|nr:SGNH/GDSL hydrolase family protein [Aquabacterium sp.]HEX5358059.1 SGNH/GDSL hydrolase family protein [Aquabacterium sp.]